MKKFNILYAKQVGWLGEKLFTCEIMAENAEKAGEKFLNEMKGRGVNVKAIDEIKE